MKKKFLIAILCIVLMITGTTVSIFADEQAQQTTEQTQSTDQTQVTENSATTDGTSDTSEGTTPEQTESEQTDSTTTETIETETTGTETSATTETNPDSTTTSTETGTETSTETGTEGTTTETTDGTTTETPEVTDETEQQAGITPDSFLYTFEKLIESVQVTLTPTEEGKTELLVEFANERLAEALIMTAKDNVKLAEKVMNTYTRIIEQANTSVKTILDDEVTNVDTQNLIEKIEVTQGDAEKVTIKITGMLPEAQAEQVKTLVEAQVKMTLAMKSYAAVKNEFR